MRCSTFEPAAAACSIPDRQRETQTMIAALFVYGRFAAPTVAEHLATGGGLPAANGNGNGTQPDQQKFEAAFAGERFKGLKAILEALCADRAALCRSVVAAKSYADLVAALGYRVVVSKQIHVQDAYSRTGPAGGIR